MNLHLRVVALCTRSEAEADEGGGGAAALLDELEDNATWGTFADENLLVISAKMLRNRGGSAVVDLLQAGLSHLLLDEGASADDLRKLAKEAEDVLAEHELEKELARRAAAQSGG